MICIILLQPEQQKQDTGPKLPCMAGTTMYGDSLYRNLFDITIC
jgi:hypothetical protein